MASKRSFGKLLTAAARADEVHWQQRLLEVAKEEGLVDATALGAVLHLQARHGEDVEKLAAACRYGAFEKLLRLMRMPSPWARW